MRASCFRDAPLKDEVVPHLFLYLHPGRPLSSFVPSLSPSIMYFFTMGSRATKPSNYRLEDAKEIDH